MNSKKVIWNKIVIAVIYFLILLSTNVFAIVKPTSNFYVNDYANLLNSETENYIMIVNQSLNSKTKAQVVVVTVKNLEGKSLEEYSTELFRNFGIGDKKLNNGVLMLIALEERQSRIEVGYGLEGILNDAKTGRIQDEYMIPYLRQNNWDEGIKNGFSAIVNEIEKEYGVTTGSENPTVMEEEIPAGFMFMFVSFFATMSIGALTVEQKNSIKIRMVYCILLAIIALVVVKELFMVMMILIFNYITLLSMNSRFAGIGSSRSGSSRGGGFSSGGGFSGGGGRSGGGRKFKKFLKN